MKKILFIVLLLPFVVSGQPSIFFGQNASGGAFTVTIKDPSDQYYAISSDSISLRASKPNCTLYLVPDGYTGTPDAAVSAGIARKVTAPTANQYYKIGLENFVGDFNGVAKDANGWTIQSSYDVTVDDVSDPKIATLRGSTSGYSYALISGEITGLYDGLENYGMVIQDTVGANNGIFIEDLTNESELDEGDVVRVLLDVNYSSYLDIVYTEFIRVDKFIADVFDTDPDTINTLSDSYSDVLVRIVDYQAGTTSSGVTPMTKSTYTVNVSDSLYSYTFTSGSNYTVTGLGRKVGTSSYYLYPRRASDIIVE